MILVRLLGGVSIEGDDGALTGRATQRHPVALLSLLAVVCPTVVSRDKLVGRLWPEKDSAGARNLLNQAVHALRRALGARAVITKGDGLALDPEIVESDVGRFESALREGDPAAAVSLYKGAFLDGFFLGGSPEFERWVDGERQRLRHSYLRALEDLAERAGASGNRVEAADWWRRLAAQEPYNSRIAVCFMEALEAAGDRAAAIRHAESYASSLERNLGASPHPEVIALAERMRLQPAASLGHGTPPGAALPAGSEATVAGAAAHRARGVPHRLAGIQFLRKRGAIAALVAVTVSLAGILAATVLGRDGARFDVPAAPDAMAGPAIAVLPFRNLTGDSSLGQLVDGLAELLPTQLYRVAAIGSIAPSAVREYQNTSKSVREVARELGVATVLEGSLRSTGEHAVFNAWLVDGATGRQLWADLYERELKTEDLFSIQVDVARRIAAALSIELAADPERGSAMPPTGNAEAYEYYVRGTALMSGPMTGPHARRDAEWMFRQAVRIDPEFAVAWAALAEWHSSAVTGIRALALAIHRPPTLPGEGSVTADTALDRAIALGPDLPETVRARGWYEFNVMRDRETALGHFEAARLMRPGDPDLTGAIGLIRISQGAWDEGLAYLEGAMRLDPRSYWRAGLLGQMYAHARRYEDAERWYDRALLVAPSYAEGYIGKAIVHLKRDGDIGRALEVLEQASKNVDRGEFIFSFTQVMSRHPFIRILDNYFQAGLGDSSIALYLRQRCTGCYLQLEAELAESRDDVQVARVYYDSAYGMYGGQSRRRPSRLLTLSAAALGRYGEATRYAEELLEFAPLSSEAVSGYHVLETVAETRVRIGDSDGAIAALEQLLSHPGLLSVPVLELDPLWDPLREHPEFQRLLRQYR